MVHIQCEYEMSILSFDMLLFCGNSHWLRYFRWYPWITWCVCLFASLFFYSLHDFIFFFLVVVVVVATVVVVHLLPLAFICALVNAFAIYDFMENNVCDRVLSYITMHSRHSRHSRHSKYLKHLKRNTESQLAWNSKILIKIKNYFMY